MLLKLLGGILNLGIMPIVILFVVMMFGADYLGPLVGAGGSLGDLLGGLIPLEGAEGASAEAFGNGGLVTLFVGVIMGRIAGFFRSQD